MNILTPVVAIFLLLTVYENFLEKTIFGNLPALFMGLASSFFTFLIKPANAAPITPIHLVVFFVYGVILALLLAGGGLMFCSLFFGKQKGHGSVNSGSGRIGRITCKPLPFPPFLGIVRNYEDNHPHDEKIGHRHRPSRQGLYA